MSEQEQQAMEDDSLEDDVIDLLSPEEPDFICSLYDSLEEPGRATRRGYSAR